ncbi:MAG: excinuclease ABC subunit UvrC [Deltaproteobacteria bacterium]|nr:excinuclease ABC subunit UvrC [Deltaproteobacteria bacterium]
MLNQDFLKSIPHSPGVYMMLDRKSNVLYVGKAKDLYKRLATYVHFSGAAHSKTAVMLSQVGKVNTLITHTEKEALILEASLIKKHRPKYNVILRDDKSYPLIKVTLQEEWPRVFMTRRKRKDGARYFGPYSSSSAMWSTLKLLSSLFPLRRCKGGTLKPRKRPCLNHQMNQCMAPCAGIADRAQYIAMVDKVILFLEGRNRQLLSDLQAEMTRASASMEFEKAALVRDQMRSLNRTLEKQVVVSELEKDRDVFGLARKGASVSTALLYIRGGMIQGSRSFFLADPYGDDAAILSQVLKLMYDETAPPPAEILLPVNIEDQDILAERLADFIGKKVSLTVPMRGDRRHLIAMANTNAKQLFEDIKRKEQSWKTLSDAMMRKLALDSPPQAIECIDISNISGTNTVGSLISFKDGEPDKQAYRHFKIKSVHGPDDYASMREVLSRRFERGVENNDLPDLLIVDGGRGQLGIAEAVAKDFGIIDSIDLLGIAKERNDEGEKLYKPGRKNPIILLPHNPVLLYIMRIRDEAHRYGITFHRSLRRKSTMSSVIDQIPGVGSLRKKQLLISLGSMKKISQASVNELKNVDGIGSQLAEEIYQFFRT